MPQKYILANDEKTPEVPVAAASPNTVQTSTSPAPGDSIDVVLKEKDAPARTVFVRMAKIEGATKYEVEIRSSSQRWGNPYQFQTVAGTLRFRLTPAKYELRARSAGKGNQRGEWGKWREFIVPFRSVASMIPADGASIQSSGQEIQYQTFEWPKTKDSEGYYVEVRDKDDKPVRKVKTKATWVTSPLKSGSKYRWCVLPLSDFAREEPRIADCKFSSFTIETSQDDLPAALTKVEARPDALGYQYEIIRYENAQSTGEPIIVESETPNLRAQLKAGEYEMRVRTLFQKDYRTDWSPPQKFFVRQPPPEPLGPLAGTDIEGSENGDGEIVLTWKPIPGVDRYDVYVFDAEGKVFFQDTSKEPSIKVKLAEDHHYLWKVVAYSPREPNRTPAAVVNGTGASEFYIKPYFPYQLSVSEDPAPTYSWARYTVSSANYFSENYDDNAIVRQSIQAGELDMAIGYWYRKTRLGLLAQGGIEGYKTNTDSAFFKGGSANIGYRFVWSGDERGKIWIGYGYREIASLRANPTTLQYEIKSLNAAGPRLQFTYGNQFSETWGYQIHGKGFFGMKDMGTPNKEKQGTQISFALSAAFTHPLSKRTIGLLGYTYQLDSSSYASADTPGKTNTTKITGHYLTLGVEFAVGDVKK